MNILYCIDDIASLGGTERITITKINKLSEDKNLKIKLLVQRKDNHSHFISPNINLQYLNIKNSRNKKNYLHESLYIISFKLLILFKLIKVIKDFKPKIIISIGNEYILLPFIKLYFKVFKKFNFKIIRELHYSRPQYEFYQSKDLFHKLIHKLSSTIRHNLMFRFYDKIVTLTLEDKNVYWNNKSNIVVIPNPLTFESDIRSNLISKKIIAMGRLVEIKNFSSLIRSFNLVYKKHKDWILEIYGEGPLKQYLLSEIKSLGLEKNVLIYNRIENVKNKFLDASICVVPSLCEAFCLVIIESMSCGVPVISYNFPCGPKEIINDKINGLLVSVNDETNLAEKICFLIEHENLRKKLGEAAYYRSKDYSINSIIIKWKNLFQELIQRNI